MDAIKITVERGNKQDGMKKAVAYCDTEMFYDGKCKEADCPMEDDLNICCAVCDYVFDCQGSCPKVEVQNDEP